MFVSAAGRDHQQRPFSSARRAFLAHRMNDLPTFRIKQEAYAAIKEQFACAHHSRELRLRIIADGRSVFYRQCTQCGNADRAISRAEATKELQGAKAPPFDDDAEPKWRADMHATYIATYHAIKPGLEVEYQKYLSSPEWREKRDEAINRANRICECCELFPATIGHHLTYDRIGNELPSDLVAVCFHCHALIHRRQPA